MAAESTKTLLEQILRQYPKQEDKALIEHAFTVAEKMHEGQKRASGESYIFHPLYTALTLSQMHLDPATVAAGLLHDVVEDTEYTEEKLKQDFGEEIAFLVQGVTTLGKLKYRGEERHAENLRKMLLAMASDIRVILIKLADRLHNMQTLQALAPEKQKRIALETLEIYAPIAMRLGVSELSKQLEDLAFPYLYPQEYKEVVEQMQKRYPEREQYLEKVKPIIAEELKSAGVHALEIQTRAKHLYSLWRKLERYKNNWDAIYDLVAVRILVQNVEDCYATLGIIHKLWRPYPGRIRDYIALPKINGYQSLHTTVFCLDGVTTEFQVRTSAMHEHAEHGIAAHWAYTEKGKPAEGIVATDPKLQWVRQIQDWHKEFSDSSSSEGYGAAMAGEFLENLKIDIFKNRIFVFTPKGAVIDLPESATPVDFAYAIHSRLGDECDGAKVNGKMVPLSYELRNGDVVDIVRNKARHASAAWLEFVKTQQARSHIRAYLRSATKEESAKRGLELLNKELQVLRKLTWEKIPESQKMEALARSSYKTLEDLLAGIGRGDISLSRVLRKIVQEKDIFEEKPVIPKNFSRGNSPIRIEGQTGMQLRIANCCNPVAGEKIVAYIPRHGGARIHRDTCGNISYTKNAARILSASWDANVPSIRSVSLRVEAQDRVGLVQDVSTMISERGINVLALHSGSQGTHAFITLSLEVRTLEELQVLLRKLKAIKDVREVRRM